MKTEIEWIDPNVTVPPFGVQFLAVLGGIGSKDFLRTSTPYVSVQNVVMSKGSPNSPGTEEYKDFIADDGDSCKFSEFQFYIVPFDQWEYGNGSESESDWYSDALLAWAPMPDFSALLAKKQAEAV